MAKLRGEERHLLASRSYVYRAAPEHTNLIKLRLLSKDGHLGSRAFLFCQNKFIIQKAFFHLIFVINELVFLKSLIKGFFEQDIGGFPTKSDSRKKERTDGHYITLSF